MPRTSTPLLLPALLSAALALPALAQTPAPTQTTSPPQTTAKPQPPANPTIQARSNLVIEDVVVTDRHGSPVHGLKASDLLLTEQNTPQTIRTFDEHTVQPSASAVQAIVLPPGTFTNYAPPPSSPALNVLLLDSLNTPLQDQAYLRQQLLQYIRSAPTNQRLAIFGLSSHLILLQSFTADPAILRAAIDRKSLRASQLLDNAATGAPEEQLSDTLSDIASAAGSGQGAAIEQAAANMRQFEADNATFQLQLRARYTLDSLSALARYLAVFPGRKNVLWFSGSFPLNVFPDASLQDPFRAAVDLSSELRDTANILSRSQVAVYPIDSRGLFNDPAFDASNRGSSAFRPGQTAIGVQQFNEKTAAEHATMRDMAQETGGRAFINTNDLAGAVTRAITDGSNFYTLTYTPADTRLDNSFRSISIKLRGAPASQGLSLSYRRGYFAVDPNSQPRRRLPPPSTGSAPPPPNTVALQTAMLRGAPDSGDIIFKASILPAARAGAPPELTSAAANQPNPKLAQAPFHNWVVDFAAFSSQLLARRSNGSYTGRIRFITLAYDADGTVVNLVDQITAVNLTPDSYKASLHGGVHFRQTISTPLKGDFYLRIGVANIDNDRIGSIEVPVATIKNLPPAPASATPQPPSPQP